MAQDDNELAQLIAKESHRPTGRWQLTPEGARRLRAARNAMQGAIGLGLQFSPLDVPGCVGWYRSDRADLTLPSDAGHPANTLARWPDSSPANNHIRAQSTTAPLVTSNVWDGKPAVVCVRGTTNGPTIDVGFLPPIATCSVFFVVDAVTWPSVNGEQVRLMGTSDLPGSANDRLLCQTQFVTGTGVVMRIAAVVGGVSTVLQGTAVVPTGRNILAFVINGASSRMRRNANADESGTTGNPLALFSWSLLSDANTTTTMLDGRCGEVVIYNRAISLAEQLLVQNYLNTKWKVF